MTEIHGWSSLLSGAERTIQKNPPKSWGCPHIPVTENACSSADATLWEMLAQARCLGVCALWVVVSGYKICLEIKIRRELPWVEWIMGRVNTPAPASLLLPPGSACSLLTSNSLLDAHVSRSYRGTMGFAGFSASFAGKHGFIGLLRSANGTVKPPVSSPLCRTRHPARIKYSPW